MLGRKRSANDNVPAVGQHKRQHGLKAILLNPEAPTIPKVLPAKTASYPRRHYTDFTPDELEEAMLYWLSKKYRRHVCKTDDKRIGYFDETLRFISLDGT